MVYEFAIHCLIYKVHTRSFRPGLLSQRIFIITHRKVFVKNFFYPIVHVSDSLSPELVYNNTGSLGCQPFYALFFRFLSLFCFFDFWRKILWINVGKHSLS